MVVMRLGYLLYEKTEPSLEVFVWPFLDISDLPDAECVEIARRRAGHEKLIDQGWREVTYRLEEIPHFRAVEACQSYLTETYDFLMFCSFLVRVFLFVALGFGIAKIF